MKTDNELIAQFMGYKFINDAPKDFPRGYYYTEEPEADWITAESMRYDESWDWLMPVVEKIQSENIDGEFTVSMGYGAISNLGIISHYTYCHIENWNGTQVAGYSSYPTLIECVYRTIVDFIKFYNQQKV